MTGSITLYFTDTETTGLIDKNPEAEITEIAVVKWCEGDKEVLLHERVRPKKQFTNDMARAIKNKSYDEKLWAKADVWDAQASQVVAELLAGHYICGSNPDFYKRMITAECYRAGQPAPRWHHHGINTASLGFPLYLIGAVEQTGLEHLAKYFNVEHQAHTALGDCFAAIGVWEAFFELYIHRPRMMSEALYEMKKHLEEGSVYAQPGHALAVINRGLVGE